MSGVKEGILLIIKSEVRERNKQVECEKNYSHYRTDALECEHVESSRSALLSDSSVTCHLFIRMR